MKQSQERVPYRLLRWGLAAVISYLVVEVFALGVFFAPTFPIASVIAVDLGFGVPGAFAFLAWAVVLAVGAEGLVIARTRAGVAQKQAPDKGAERGIERSRLNTMLDDSAKNFVEVFPLETGALNVYAAISNEEGVEGYKYVVIEPELTQEEKRQFAELKELLIEGMDVDLRSIETKEKAEAYLADKVATLAETYGFKIPRPSMRKLQYYFHRDFIHLGKIEPLMLDPLIEDVSCDGVKIPIYVWHRDYESIPTNVSFETDAELDTFVSKLAYVSGKHISLATPMVDASLQDGSRLHLTYGKEITQRGSTFCMKSGHVQLSNGVALDIGRLFKESKMKWGNRFEQGNEIVDVDGRISVVGVNEQTLGFSNSGIKQILKLPPPEALVKVWIQEGERNSEPFEVTKNHKFHVVTSDGLRLMEAADLRPDMWIPVPTKIPLEGVRLAEEDFRRAVFSCLKSSDLKLLVSLEGDVLRLAEKAVEGLGGVRQAEKILGVNRRYLSDALVKTIRRNGRSSMRLTTYFELLEAAGIEPALDEFFLRRRDHRVKIPLRLTEDLAFIVGWTLTDGLLSSRFLKVTPSNSRHRHEIARAYKDVFGPDYHLYGTSKRYFDMHFLSSAVSDFLQRVFEIPKAPKARSIRVPKFIMMSDDWVVSAFLRGVFQGDGGYLQPHQASLKSFSRLFLRDVQFLLTRFGVLSFVTSDSRLGIPVSYQDVFFDDIMRLERDVQQVAGRVGKVVPAPLAESLRTQAKSTVTLEMLRVEAGVDLRRGREQKITFDKARRTAFAIGIDADKHWFFDLIERGYDFKRISKVEVAANTDHVYDVVCGPDHFYVGGVVPSIVYDTIRKFKADPLTIIDLIKYNTVNAEVAAYLWYLIEKRLAMLVAGATASGKSVPGDTEVLIYREGKEQLAKVAQLFEDASKAGRMQREGVHDVALVAGWQTAAFDADMKVGLHDVRSVVRHKAPGRLFKLTTRSGREVETTGDHSVFTMGDRGARPFPVSELTPGMFVAVPRTIPGPTASPASVNLVEALAHDDGGAYVENIAPYCESAAGKIGAKATAAALHLPLRELKRALRRGYLAARVTRLASLSSLAYSDVFWDEVTTVETVQCHDEYVYDLEVPGAQNFVGGAGGIFLHNTTTLNSLSMFIVPGQKVISVEDTPELSLPHENWIQEVTRAEGAAGEITLFDLVRNSLRQRPDVIIVGEIRGNEAFSLFQAISTGHGGFSTIHADSIEAVFNRLTTEPMNIPRSLVGTSLDCIVLQLKLRMGDRSVRRIVSVNEILGYDNRTNEIVMNEVYKWDPVADRLNATGRSRLVDKINQRYGLRPEEIKRDLESRKVFLEWLAKKNLRSYKEVSAYVQEFYANPFATSSRARSELEAAQ